MFPAVESLFYQLERRISIPVEALRWSFAAEIVTAYVVDIRLDSKFISGPYDREVYDEEFYGSLSPLGTTQKNILAQWKIWEAITAKINQNEHWILGKIREFWINVFESLLFPHLWNDQEEIVMFYGELVRVIKDQAPKSISNLWNLNFQHKCISHYCQTWLLSKLESADCDLLCCRLGLIVCCRLWQIVTYCVVDCGRLWLIVLEVNFSFGWYKIYGINFW